MPPRPMNVDAALARLAARYARFGPPVIAFNKSHSGSRVLARGLIAGGVFLGAERNASEDSPDILRLVRHLVLRHYPDYAGMFRHGDDDLEALAASVFDRHLSACPLGARWGWKLCETLYILPVLDRIFPGATYLHLLRDGRDVAFSDHVAPVEPFWKKVYFDTDAVTRWRGLRLSHRAYRRNAHLFNAQHWSNSVRVARNYGAMTGSRYRELRYEDLAARPAATMRALLQALGIDPDEAALEAFAAGVVSGSVGRFRAEPPWRRRAVLRLLEPQLQSFGYGLEAAPRPAWRFWG